MFTIFFSPSAKRIIPYPPVSIFMLAASLRSSGLDVNPVDLEMELNYQHKVKNDVLIYKRRLEVQEVLEKELSEEIKIYSEKIMELLHFENTTFMGISVMGYEQLSTALLIARLALAKNIKVILGGQFWVEKNALETLNVLKQFGKGVAITVGDGNEAIRHFAHTPDTPPPNSFIVFDDIVKGPVIKDNNPLEPDYSFVNWNIYNEFAKGVYKRSNHIRRAHLFVWGKKCNFRCAFCRVATGSNIKLTPSIDSVRALKHLQEAGVTQLNIMTNELNPSRQYLMQFLTEMENTLDTSALSWLTYLRADELQFEDLLRIRKAGGKLMRYGIESGSQKLLDLMRKDYNVETMSATLQYAAEANIWNHVNLLVGFPHEDDEDIALTCAFLERNQQYIHSIRINPFYLPPDTPIARKPEEFGITLTGFSKGWWDYKYLNHEDGTSEALIKMRIEKLTDKCKELGIGFAGTDPFFLLDALDRFNTTIETKDYLLENYSFFWIPAPTDYYKAMIGNYKSTDEWDKSINKRGINYSLSICND